MNLVVLAESPGTILKRTDETKTCNHNSSHATDEIYSSGSERKGETSGKDKGKRENGGGAFSAREKSRAFAQKKRFAKPGGVRDKKGTRRPSDKTGPRVECGPQDPRGAAPWTLTGWSWREGAVRILHSGANTYPSRWTPSRDCLSTVLSVLEF
jgi:hypothetical protein